MGDRPEGYIPAAGRDWLLPFYDPVLRFVFREEEAKRQLLEQAELRPGHRVLDVGCGTGTLLTMTKAACPEAQVVGLDGDPKALAVAHRKTARAGIEAKLDEGLAYELPYPDASFERVFSSLVLHHLTRVRSNQPVRCRGADRTRAGGSLVRSSRLRECVSLRRIRAGSRR